jgi:hypothetical protein
MACQLPSQNKSKVQGESEPEPEINCTANPSTIAWQALLTENCNRLSDFGLFESTSEPRENPRSPGLAFKLATELFTDYAHKYRFVFVPEGKIIYQPFAALDFPIGSVLVKTFVLPETNQASSASDVIETRLLIRREHGWIGLPYVWNDTKTEAYLVLTGKAIEKQEYTFNNPDVEPKTIVRNSAPVILVEGIFIFHYQKISELIDLKIFIDAKDYIKLQRRLKRDREERGYDADDVLYKYENHIMPSYYKFIAPYKEEADLVIPNNKSFDKGLHVVRGLIQSKINDQG